jgi:hypothetical protein
MLEFVFTSAHLYTSDVCSLVLLRTQEPEVWSLECECVWICPAQTAVRCLHGNWELPTAVPASSAVRAMC